MALYDGFVATTAEGAGSMLYVVAKILWKCDIGNSRRDGDDRDH
jgi:hypothetical protein